MTDELDQLLAAWAARQRLSVAQVQQLHARVVAAVEREGQTALDAEWLWSFLRPVTDLLDQVGGARALRNLGDDDAVSLTAYLRLT